MRILFVANIYNNLYKDIEAEFIRQGHNVVTIVDGDIRFDPYICNRSKCFQKIKTRLWRRCAKRYWQNQIKNNRELSKSFDLLFALSGCSITEEFIAYLENINKKIKKVLYTFDTCNFYRFDKRMHLFDKSYTFDIEDVKKNPRWNLLPIYYKDSGCEKTQTDIIYDLFCVGANLNGRYSFIKRLLPQLRDENIKYWIKIIPVKKKFAKIRRIISMFLYPIIPRTTEQKEEYKFSLGKENTGLLRHNYVDKAEYNYLSNVSNCVLDSQRDGQTGLTARFMWALADKKKIITTNKWALDYPFVNLGQVRIVDKFNPLLPIEFIKTPLKESELSDVEFVRIDNWVKTILS